MKAAVIAAEADVNALHKRALAELSGSVGTAADECRDAYQRVIGSLPQPVVQSPENNQVLEQLEAVLGKVFEAAKQQHPQPPAAVPPSEKEFQTEMDVDDQTEINAIYEAIVAASIAGNGGGDAEDGSKQLLLKRLGKVTGTMAAKRSKVGERSG